MHAWNRHIEELKLASLDRGKRVLALTSPLAFAGTSQVARMLADASRRAGQRTLLVDLAERVSSGESAWPWRARMVVFEGATTPDEVGIRLLRRSLQQTVGKLRVTSHLVEGVALAAADLAVRIVEEARPNRIAVRIAVIDTALLLEITHDGAPMHHLDERLTTVSATALIAPGDSDLAFLLARRALPRWSYVSGAQHRLIGWCALDGAPAGCEPPSVENLRAVESLVADPVGSFRGQFNNVDQMRELVHRELDAYEAIIVDLPPIIDDGTGRINPLATLAAVDGAVLVCKAGKVDRDSVARSMKLLEQSGVVVLGLVVNDAENPSLGSELAREARRLRRLAPGLSRWLERKALSARMLN